MGKKRGKRDRRWVCGWGRKGNECTFTVVAALPAGFRSVAMLADVGAAVRRC